MAKASAPLNPFVKQLVTWGAVAAVGLGALAVYNAHERQVGALAERIKVLTATHYTDSVAALTDKANALRSSLTADSLRAAYRRGSTVVVQAERHSDTAIAALAITRDSALTVANNAEATAGQLRVSIVGLSATVDSALAAFALERATFTKRLAAADSLIDAFRQSSNDATRALGSMEKRATDSEGQVKILKAQMPSGFWLWTERIGSAGAVLYFATRKK